MTATLDRLTPTAAAAYLVKTGWTRMGERDDAAYQQAQFAGTKIFFAHLYAVYAVVDGADDTVHQPVGATRGTPVRNVVAQHQAGV